MQTEQIQTENKQAPTRLFIRVTRETLPRVTDRYPFLYLERGRLEIDDSSIKWIDSEGMCIRLPVATLNCLLLGPGTSVTHEAIKVASAANCHICWVGEDSLLFYSAGITPTSDSRNIRRQAMLSAHPDYALAVAKALFAYRFPKEDLKQKTLQELMGMEGFRVRDIYQQKAQEYGVGWRGREFIPGKFELADMTNQILTSANAALYGLLSSVIHSLGYSPHLGFIHSGSPLPFVYDLADLYKVEFSIDLAFYLTRQLAGQYNKYAVAEAFRQRVLKKNLLERAVADIDTLLGEKSARRYSK
ncbi:MAG: type I-E CRISPR-associated endonuclease Cas1e [Desulfovibrionaceae bacterium]|nr:type I-E CRISPR-associated endonuclease Cas1e [Desulfovibrionaceae bacterium]